MSDDENKNNVVTLIHNNNTTEEGVEPETDASRFRTSCMNMCDNTQETEMPALMVYSKPDGNIVFASNSQDVAKLSFMLQKINMHLLEYGYQHEELEDF